MKNLYAALIKFQSQLKPIAKTKENPYFKSHYADLTGLWDAVRPALAENNLCVTQIFDGATEGDQHLITRLIHVSGESLDSKTRILLAKSDAQSFGSATTYYRRYAFSAILGLTTEEDDDGNAAVSKPSLYPGIGVNKTVLSSLVREIDQAPYSPPLGQAIGFSSSYIPKFGKYAGKPFNEIDPKALENYITFLEKSAKEQGKPLSKNVIEFIQEATSFLSGGRQDSLPF